MILLSYFSKKIAMIDKITFNSLPQAVEELHSKIDNLFCLIQKIQENPNPKKTPEEIEKPLSQPEACKFLGKSRQTLIKWRKKGIIKSYRLNGRVYFKPSELLEALKKN